MTFGGHLTNTTCPAPEIGPREFVDHLDNQGINGFRLTKKIAIVPYIGTHTFHSFAIIFCGACTAFTVVVSGLHIMIHALRFSRPEEQKHIIRIITMLIFFAVISFVSTFMNNNDAQYILILLDLYEAFAFGSFFLLLCAWIWRASAQDTQAAISEAAFQRRAYPKASALVFQFPAVMIILTIVVEITEGVGKYCVASSSIHFAHLWVTIFKSIATAIAFITVLDIYRRSRHGTSQHRPTLKFIAFKSIIGLRFIQTLLFSFLTSRNDIAPSKYLSYDDISVSIPAMVLNIEMVLYSCLFLYAFRTSGYVVGSQGQPQVAASEAAQPDSGDLDQKAMQSAQLGFPTHYVGGPLGLRAIGSALNVTDLVIETMMSPVTLFSGSQRR